MECDDLPSANSMLFYWYYFPAILVLLLPSHLYLKKPIEKKIIRTCDKGGGGIKKVKKEHDIIYGRSLSLITFALNDDKNNLNFSIIFLYHNRLFQGSPFP